jgi:chromate reductase
MGAATGMMGTVRAQMHLRQILVNTNSYVVNKPEVLIAHARQKFDQHGHLVDEPTRALISDLLVALVELTRRLKTPESALTK